VALQTSGPAAFERLELFVGVAQVFVLWLVRLVSGAAAGSERDSVRRPKVRLAFLQERNRRSVSLVGRGGEGIRAFPKGDQFLFVVEELPLETWVWVDHTALRFDVAHRFEQAHAFFLHHVRDHASCRSRLASVTAT
jgi:hypothetical protein